MLKHANIELLLGIIILVFAWLPTLWVSGWIITIAAILLIIHSLTMPGRAVKVEAQRRKRR